MAKILTQAQAEAVLNAMASMNNVGGFIKCCIQSKTVETIGGRWIVVMDHSENIPREEYDGQHLFQCAYNL